MRKICSWNFILFIVAGFLFYPPIILHSEKYHQSPPVIPGKKMQLEKRTRDAGSGEIVISKEIVDSRKMAVVIVDPWNFHWCMTATERVSAMVPRWKKALEGARQLGMPIIWAPSDVVGSYAGYPQRERVLGLELLPVPSIREMPSTNFTAPMNNCMCGPGIKCKGNYGWDAMSPEFNIADDDFIASSTDEVYTLLKRKDISHVVYMGLHTNICLYGKPGALKYMVQAGFTCMLARDINDAITIYDPVAGFTPDKGTQQTDEDLERAGVPTINFAEELGKVGLWNKKWVVETVRITPWGKPLRPYFFNESVIVTLTTPLLENADIRYTLDGSEPDKHSLLYTAPFELSHTAQIKTAAFGRGKKISLQTEAYFVKANPVPPLPDVYVDQLKNIVDPYASLAPVFAACFREPAPGTSYDGKPLQISGEPYDKGIGFQAPAAGRYELRPEFDRFVARVGIADHMVQEDDGRNKAMHCSVLFRIFIDGEMYGESPVMRISQVPWNFDIKIPAGARYLRIVAMDAGSRSTYDLANCVNAGFVVKK